MKPATSGSSARAPAAIMILAASASANLDLIFIDLTFRAQARSIRIFDPGILALARLSATGARQRQGLSKFTNQIVNIQRILGAQANGQDLDKAGIRRLSLGLLLVALLASAATQAADVGPPLGPPDRYPKGFVAIAPRCRVVPQPQFNLYNDVTWYRPIWVCRSRGIYTDTFWPYPMPY